MAIRDDAKVRADLFLWNGAIPKEDLDRWIASESVDAPVDLLRFWAETGGGEVFETETLLGPTASTDAGDDVVGVTRAHRARGMHSSLLVFHVGLGGLSVVRSHDRGYLSIDDSKYTVQGEFDSFDDWYRTLIRAEYAARYGL